jgi:hypothetical protein
MSRLGVTSWFELGISARVSTSAVLVTCGLLERLKRAADDKDVRLALMIQWGGNEIANKEYQRPAEMDDIIACAGAAGIRTVDTWPALKAVFARGDDALKALYVMHPGSYPYGHMSPAGNQFVAELLAKSLRD